MMALIIAVQSWAFVLIGNYILQIKEMSLAYWVVLFSTGLFAAMLGLNLSDAFRKSVNVYIIIPFLVIPQLILSGVFVSYDRLNPYMSNVKGVPWYGELTVSRWAFEAIATHHFMNNRFEKEFYLYNKAKSQANYNKDFWVPALSKHLERAKKYNSVLNLNGGELQYSLDIIRHELTDNFHHFTGITPPTLDSIRPVAFNETLYFNIKEYLNDVKQLNIKRYNKADELHESKRKALMQQAEGESNENTLTKLKKMYQNEDLERLMRNNQLLSNPILEYQRKLWQKTDPIYQDPESGLFSAHLLAPYKRVGNITIYTLHYNIAIIWIGTILLFVTLYYGLMSKTLNAGKHARRKIRRRKVANNNHKPMEEDQIISLQ